MLKVQNLRKQLPDGRSLFNDLSFTLGAGQVMTLTGPSGVGKTTLLKCLAQMEGYDNGSVTLDGKTPAEWGYATWRSRVTYVPQRVPVMPGTALNFLATIRAIQSQQASTKTQDDPMNIAAEWGISHSLWSEQFSKLSGGEAQRILLAIALSTNPDVLLLDEPTSALDPVTTLLVEQSLRQRCCVWITHEMDQADRVSTNRLVLSLSDEDMPLGLSPV
ncbi:hypothetical protein RI367_005633 [Sorochytrium milnesiophthora]